MSPETNRGGACAVPREVKVVVRGESENAAAWLEETERRCPVTDNIRADTTVAVTLR